MINKVDDSIASKVHDDKSKDIRLAYGNLEGFRNMIQETCDTTTNSAKTYAERAEYLKHKLKKSYAGKNDCKNRLITVRKSCHAITGIKCLEKQKTKS